MAYNKEQTMYKAVCSACHKACEVPFRPNGVKPVFCDSCFRAARETTTQEYMRKKDKVIYDAPEGAEHFVPLHSQTSSSDAKIMELKREINSVNAKLDKLVDLVSKLSPKKIAVKNEEQSDLE